MSENNEDAEQNEGIDPHDLEAIYAAAKPDDEFIVKIDFSYCDVCYNGYRILSGKELGELLAGLKCGAQVETANMPSNWYEEFDVGYLEGAFSIHSSDPDDVEAMRSLFGESVGETSYFDRVFDAFCETSNSDEDTESEKESPDHIDLGVAERFLENPDEIDLSGASTIDDDAAAVLAKHQGFLDLSGVTKISKKAEDALLMHQGTIRLSSLTEISKGLATLLASQAVSDDDDMTCELDNLTDLSEECAEIIASAKFHVISFNSLKNISPQVISKLSNSGAMINLDGLTSISREQARAITSLNVCSLCLGGIRELGDEICEILSSFGSELCLDNLEEVSPVGAQALLRSGGVVTDLDLDAIANE